MLSVVTLIGLTGPKTEDEIRTVEVTRAYCEDMHKPHVDTIAVILWSRDRSSPFYSVPAGNLVTIKGRLEVINCHLYVIAEQVNFI
ncbi:MAG TPA: hypothetical protein VJZ48_00370 [Bacilli bacterium]|nr:hypothetical protein [Bacilli bacterium]